MTGDLKALWASVVAAPLDAAPKLVLADWLQERDLDPDLERGLRWCAEKGKWPARESPDSYSRFVIDTYWHRPYFSYLEQQLKNAIIPIDIARKMASLGSDIATGGGNGVGISAKGIQTMMAVRPETLVRRVGRALARLARQKVTATY